MPRVGSYTYPLFRLNALLRETKTLHEKFGTKEFTRDHVAQVLGQKSTSGGLSQKLADLKAYGLISNTQGRFTVTDIGIKATFGTDAERPDSLDKAVRNIPLWRAIYEKCGKDPLVDTFNLELAEITGITRPKSQTVAESVRKSYMDDAKYLLTVNVPSIKPDSKKDDPDKESEKGSEGARDRRPKVEITETPGFIHIKYPGCCDAIIDIYDESSLGIVESLLTAIKTKLKAFSEDNT
jgi:hypothetical protein